MNEDTVTITINKNLAAAIGLEQDTDIIAFVMDDMLIIRAKHYKTDEEAKKAVTQSLINKYEGVLKKLAKTGKIQQHKN